VKPRRGALLIAGVMSGTSLDGLDVALVECGPGRAWKLRGFRHAAYTRPQRARLLAAATGAANAPELARLHVWLGQRIGAAVRDACRASHLPLERLSAVASHGQTVYHEGGVATLQLGDPAQIAAVTGAAAVSDFRAADLAAGGQGAPLVPWVDYQLWRHPRRYRAALNLGGIANLTLIPPAARPQQVTAFDTGPGNMACDALMQRLSGGRRAFDRNGAFARSGAVLPRRLQCLLRHPYLRRRPPKSAGREQFGAAFVDALLRAEPAAAPADLMATLVAFTAAAVARGLDRGGALAARAEVIVSGGGVHNAALMAALRAAAPGCQWRVSDEFGVPSQAKEALAFALLGAAHLRGLPANLPAATGAHRPVRLGSFTPPP